jgi:hypothetical protein
MQSLKALNLRETRITQAGRDRLAESLPQYRIQWCEAEDNHSGRLSQNS